ncbi:DUF1361 domain-containing protein [Flavobacterium sp. D11R37]|uniref:DUF1361 domain-containing protein n=1 Tax=Flavobacterium coralii TaxID=2838017 RepID=UPI001CA6C78D|nr:DUF1361 domain-containing protein [Flavobacterium coralii]MBY8961846.1 DUF1361 domain-containing protein [Flavobacterium coralii]
MSIIRNTITSTFRQHYALLYLALFCVFTLLVRVKITHSVFYLFLMWNLFLAYVPLLISSVMINNPVVIERRRFFYPMMIVWLLFLPNAPYIITDFIHLKKDSSVPVWFDVLLLISFTIAGILAGLTSMKHMFNMLSIKFNPLLAWVSIGVICLLCGFGIYVGRFLRYNSWDVLKRPLSLTADMLTSFTQSTPLGITLGFGCFLFLLFNMFYSAEK